VNIKPSEEAVKALALKLDEDKSRVGEMGRQAMKVAGIKANDINYATYASYGDEWVGVAYSQALWDAIRVGTFVAANIPSIEVPQGHESIKLPIEGADPTFYKVAEATAYNGSIDLPDPTVPESKLGTGDVHLTLAKMGARVGWSGELEEDSLIPFVSQLRKQLQVAGAENLEHVIIDGDTATGASSNVNTITSTPAGTEVWLLFDGFRVSALDTTTTNARDGGAITTSDFLETLKLMGTAGINALDINKCAFICDVNTHWKVSELSEVLTRDVFTQPTLEGGLLKSIFGYPVYGSANMHKASANRKAASSGGIDKLTTTNNTTGSLLAVRWDQWLLGYRRRMTLETTRYPASDSSEIVALMRLGMVQRDTEAAAISYNLTV
jgi:HK97 family phage major capsid protein